MAEGPDGDVVQFNGERGLGTIGGGLGGSVPGARLCRDGRSLLGR